MMNTTLQILPEYLEQEKLHQIAEIGGRHSLFHGGPDIPTYLPAYNHRGSAI